MPPSIPFLLTNLCNFRSRHFACWLLGPPHLNNHCYGLSPFLCHLTSELRGVHFLPFPFLSPSAVSLADCFVECSLPVTPSLEENLPGQKKLDEKGALLGWGGELQCFLHPFPSLHLYVFLLFLPFFVAQWNHCCTLLHVNILL